MKIDVRREGTLAILVPDGSITIGPPCDALRTALDAAIDGGASAIIIDGSRVRYLDSTGMGEIIAGLRRLMPSGGKVGIASPSPKLREILDITGLTAIFVTGDDEAAVKEKLAAT
jgi:anti-anti-sigma factor